MKRTICMLLVLALITGMMPINVWAEETETSESVSAPTSVEGIESVEQSDESTTSTETQETESVPVDTSVEVTELAEQSEEPTVSEETGSYPVINADETTTVEISTGGEYAYFSFTPEYTESYTFYSIGSYDTYGYLYDSDMNQLAYNDDGGENSNYSITYTLEAGVTYILAARFYSSSKTDSFNVMLQTNHSGEGVVTDSNSCTEDGMMTYTCSVCGEVYTEIIPAAGHKWVGEVTTPSSCTVDGVRTYTCRVCKETYTESIPSSHTWNDDNVCSVCGELFYESGSCGDDLTWSLDNLGTLTISGSGAMNDYGYASETEAPWYLGTNIMSIVIEDGVTSIGNYAFHDCIELTSISIPNSITRIGSFAFDGCKSLNSITIPENVASIGRYAFGDCTGLTEIVFYPTELSSNEFSYDGIFYNAGTNSTGIEVTIGENVKVIPNYTFSGYSATYNIPNIKSVVFEGHSTCEYIGYGAFRYCDNISSIILPESVTSIGSYAFFGCANLEHVVIPSTVTDMGSDIFGECPQLLTAGTLNSGCNIEFGWSETIPKHAFGGCSSIRTITIPESVVVFDEAAFQDAVNLSYINIPKNMVSIGANCFVGCENLKTVGPLGSHCNIEFAWDEAIVPEAFKNCNAIEEITIPESIRTLGKSAFENCTKLTKICYNAISIPDGTSAFAGAGSDGVGITVVVGPNVRRIPGSQFNEYVIEIEFGSNTVCEEIGAYAFQGCAGLTTVTIPESITSLGQYAFADCEGLRQINYNAIAANYDGSYILPPFAGAGSSDLTLCVGNKVTRIPDALCDESNVSKVIFEENSICTSIGCAAFSTCENLTYISIPESVVEFESGVFGSAYGVSAGKSGLTSAGPVGGGYSIEFAWTDEIPANAFNGCSTLTEVYIPESITNIGESAFMDCNQLTSITIPKNVKTIGKNAFKNCRGLEEILFWPTLMNDLESDSEVFHCTYGFYGESVKVTIGSNVTRIPAYLFGTADSDLGVNPYQSRGVQITDIQFEENSACESIGAQAFYRCNELKIAEIPSSVRIIEKNAFGKCLDLTDIYYGGMEENWTNIEISDGNSPLWNATRHYTLGSEDSGDESLLNTGVHYFYKWDAEKQIAYFNTDPEENPLNFGSQVTEETDTSFLENVDELVGTYVLVKTQARDDGMLLPDTLISIKPLETYIGVVTAVSTTDGTVTIDGTTYAYTFDWLETVPEVGDYVKYRLYEGKIVSLEIVENSSTQAILYFSSWDEENQMVYFGRDVQSMAAVTDDTDTSFLNELDNLLGRYVLVDLNVVDGTTELVSIKAVDTNVGTVSAVDATSVTIDGTTYTVDVGVLSGIAVDDYILYHIYEDEIIAVEVLQILSGDLMGWVSETRMVSIRVDNSEDAAYSYLLSDLADEATLELLNTLSSGDVTIVTEIQFACDEQGIVYHIKEPSIVVDGTFDYLTSANTIGSYTYHYDESWFWNSSYTYQHDLVKMALRVTMAAGDVSIVDGTSDGAENIKALMESLGFAYSDSFSSYPVPTYDSIGYAIGSKEIIAEDGEETTLIMIAVRGSGYQKEWGGNFRVGSTSDTDHEGFRRAADQVIAGLENYIQANSDVFTTRIKVWISGFSRAAATTNLVAAYLDDGNIAGIAAKDVYAFCFECPQNTTSTEANQGLYNNIVNIINPLDLVTKVAMSDWNFKRYGLDYYLPSAVTLNEIEYDTLKSAMQDEYHHILSYGDSSSVDAAYIEKLTNEISGQSAALDDLMSIVASALKNRTYYSYNYEPTFVESIGDALGGGEFDAEQALNTFIGLVELIDSSVAEFVLAGGTNLFAIDFNAHEMPLCLAWIDSIDGLTSTDYRKCRKIFINCPIDVEVYRGTALVGQIIDDVPTSIENGVATYIDPFGQKVIVLPNDAEYAIYLTALDDCHMTYTVSEYNIGSSCTERIVSYYDVELKKGEQLLGIVEDLGETSDALYSLGAENGDSLVPTIDQAGNEVMTYTVCTEAHDGGSVTSGGYFVCGEYCKVIATANEGYVFTGWYLEDERVSQDAEYRFAVTSNITLTAQFDKVQCNYGDPLFNWASDNTCTASFTCVDCNDTQAVECSINSVTTSATCTEAGEIVYIATVEFNGETYTDTKAVTIDALGHSYETIITTPTCTEQGYTTHTCTRCADSYVDSYVDATGHSYGNWTETKAATCTAVGEETRTCASCGESETREIEALGHDYESVVTAPTCTEQGYTTHTCSRCEDSYVDSYVDATGHAYGNWTETKAATCSEAGEESRTCASCGDSETREIEALGHDYESVVTVPTCTEQGYTTHTCTRCTDSYVDSYVDATGHSYGDWTETKAATCTEAGEETRTCASCNESETREIAALGHDYESVVTVPTCTEQGYTTHTCSRCGDSYVDSYVEATGHSYGDWAETKAATCTEAGEESRTCASCNESETREIAALGHNYESVVTDPTETEHGYTTHTCQRCGDSYVDSYTDPTGHEHIWDEGVVTREATCTENGEITYTCSCGETKAEIISALGHRYEAVITEPTCTEQGYTTHTCSYCGDSYVDSYIDATGHTFKNGECTECGERDSGNGSGCNWGDVVKDIISKIVSWIIGKFPKP